MMAVVSVSLYFFHFFTLVPLTRSYYCIEIVVLNYLKSQISDLYSVDFLGKGRVFLFESVFSVCLLYT